MLTETSPETKLKEPIFYCALINSPDYVGIPAREHPMFLRGIYDFKKRLAEPVKRVLLRSLEYVGYQLPTGFSILACEVFYRDQHIDEVRCCGTYVSGTAAGGDPVYSLWSTPAPPRFSMTLNREFMPAPEDLGRTCVMANQTESAFTLSWDLTAHENITFRDDAEIGIIMVTEHEDPPPDASQKERIWALVDDLEKDLRGQPLEHVRRQLRALPPADAGEHRSVVVGDDYGTLTYTYDVERVEYSLRSGYADSMKLTQSDVEGHMRSLSITEDKAKAAILLKHMAACEEFIAAGLANFEQKVRSLLEDTSAYMRLEVNALALAEWERSEGRARHGADAMKEAALRDIAAMAKRRLKMRRRGRPEGSGARPDEDKVTALNDKHQSSIVEAMQCIFRETNKETGNVFAAEDAITRKAVAKQIPCSRTTLNDWLGQMHKEFDELKDEALANMPVQ